MHQFVRIGRHAFVGGCSRVAKDVPPFLKAVGNPVKLYGLNSVGLQRNGFPEEVVRELKRAYRLFFRSELNVSQAMERARDRAQAVPRGQDFLRFVEESERGVGRLSAPVRDRRHRRRRSRLPSRSASCATCEGATFAGFHERAPERAAQVASELGVRAFDVARRAARRVRCA